jgi:hypothetical protein
MKVNIINELKEDKEEVVDLLFRSFKTITSKDYFIDFIDNVPYQKFIVVKDADKCVGVLCLLDRDICIKSVHVKTTWMSYMAVDSRYKTFKITNLLKKTLFQYSSKTSLLTVGIARKALDGYWYPYGFLGATNFSEIHIDKFPSPKISTDFLIKDFNVSGSVPLRLVELYNYTYAKISGSIVRDKSIWQYHLQKIINQELKLKYVVKKSVIIGYFLYKENKVLEVFGTNFFIGKAHKIISAHIVDEKCNKLIYEIGLSHPATPYLAKYNHSINQRFAWNGGHVVKVESVLSLLDVLLPIIEERLVKVSVCDFEIFIGDIKFSYKNKILMLSRGSHAIVKSNNKQDWMKIILGVCDYQEFDFIDLEDEGLIKLMFENLHFQIPLLDHM